MRDVIINILEKLDNSDYFDPAEHLYDGIKTIKGHLNNDDDLNNYIDDFIWALSSDRVFGYDGTIKECLILLDVVFNRSRKIKRIIDGIQS